MERRASEPAPERLPATRRRSEEHPLRAGRTRGAAVVDHVAEVAEDGDRAIDERPADRPDAADLSVRDEGACEVPAMSGALAEKAEHGPLGERGLGTGDACHGSILGRRVADEQSGGERPRAGAVRLLAS